ncbi:MAG: phosphatase PAP2 family protein [Catonella sp.]
MIESLINFEGSILLFLQNYVRNPVLNALLIPFTLSNNAGIPCILIVAVFIYFKSLRKAGILMGISLLLEFLLNNLIIKNLFARIRPYEVIDGLILLVGKAPDYSFPSGHTGSAFALAVVIFMVMDRKYGIIALILASLMGFSRLYVGIHYPSDVLGGVILGVVTSVIAVKCFPDSSRLMKKFIQ